MHGLNQMDHKGQRLTGPLKPLTQVESHATWAAWVGPQPYSTARASEDCLSVDYWANVDS